MILTLDRFHAVMRAADPPPSPDLQVALLIVWVQGKSYAAAWAATGIKPSAIRVTASRVWRRLPDDLRSRVSDPVYEPDPVLTPDLIEYCRFLMNVCGAEVLGVEMVRAIVLAADRCRHNRKRVLTGTSQACYTYQR